MAPKDKVQEIIEDSGNSFQSNVITFLREKEWTVLVSPYYNDNLSDKAREIDILAEKPFEVKDLYGTVAGMLNVRFIVECKYINTETIFWFDTKDMEYAEKRVITSTPLRKNNKYIEDHHYMASGSVAKLFASGKNKDLSNEPIYKAINQSLNAMVYFRHGTSIVPRKYTVLANVSYPIIILNDFNKIYRVNIGESDYSQITDNYFQLEINYAYLDRNKKNINEYFLIDVVNFAYLDDFLNKILKKDVDAISAMIRMD